MPSFTVSPRVQKAGLVILDPVTGTVTRVITLQYNPDSVTRSISAQTLPESGDFSDALRLKGPAVETLKIEAELDATDALEKPDQSPDAVRFGLHPQIAALEGLLNPTADHLLSVHGLEGSGTLEVIPAQSPFTVLVWGANRIQPVRLTDLSVTEEAFDPQLNPIRAKVTIGLRVLTVADVGFNHRLGTLFLGYLRGRESQAAKLPPAGLGALGIGGLP